MRDTSQVRIRSGNVEVELPVESVAYALLDRENKPINLDEGWANGDGAVIMVVRVSWQTTDWRMTTNGWRRGPYRVWSDVSGRYGVECKRIDHGLYEFTDSLEAAKARCRRHCEDDLQLAWNA